MVSYSNSPSPNNWPIPHLCAQKYAPYCDSQSLFQLKYKKLLEMVYFFLPHTIVWKWYLLIIIVEEKKLMAGGIPFLCVEMDYTIIVPFFPPNDISIS